MTGQAGYPATAAQYFNDLRFVSLLIRVSWPRINSLIDTPAALAELCDRDSRQVAKRGIQLRLYNEPPLDAAASSALLIVADLLLSHSARDLSQQIMHLLAYRSRRASKAPWTRSLIEERPTALRAS